MHLKDNQAKYFEKHILFFESANFNTISNVMQPKRHIRWVVLLTLLYSTCSFSCSLSSLSFKFFCSEMLSWIWIIRMFRSEYQWDRK